MIIHINGVGAKRIHNNINRKEKAAQPEKQHTNDSGTVISLSFENKIEETINLRKVNELRQLIADGDYKIDAEGIAKAIVELHET